MNGGSDREKGTVNTSVLFDHAQRKAMDFVKKVLVALKLVDCDSYGFRTLQKFVEAHMPCSSEYKPGQAKLMKNALCEVQVLEEIFCKTP